MWLTVVAEPGLAHCKLQWNPVQIPDLHWNLGPAPCKKKDRGKPGQDIKRVLAILLNNIHNDSIILLRAIRRIVFAFLQ